MEKAGLSLADIGLFEINEAFASQFHYCVEELRIPLDRVNVNGGAIALGRTSPILLSLSFSRLRFRFSDCGRVRVVDC